MLLTQDMDDPTANDLPVRDSPAKRGPIKNISEAKERQLVAALSRQDLEDRYLRLREDHVELKKLTRTQEEKMKQMATKLLRLVKDKRKLDDKDGVPRRDAETTEFIEDLQDQIRELVKANEALKNKLTVTKQQMHVQGRRQTPYDNVKPRVQTGISTGRASSRQQRIKEQIRMDTPVEQRPSGRAPPPLLPQPRYGHSLLEEARIEKRELEDLIASLQEQIRTLEEEGANQRNQIRRNRIDFEEEKADYEAKIAEMKKSSLKENVELVRLEREIKEKSNKLEAMQTKFLNLEQMLEKIKLSNEKSLNEMETLTLKLKEEQTKNSTLHNEIRQADFLKKAISEKDETIADLRAENDVLKETQEKILQSTFDAERERRFRLKEREYQVKISQLEAVTKADVLEKNDVLDKLSQERDENKKTQTELKELRIKYYSQKELFEDLSEKMKFISKESNIDFDEMQEAIMLIRARKEKQSQELSFLEKVDEEMNHDLRKQLLELQTAHADTINELDKTRNMLLMQNKINRDYQTEVEATTQKMNDLRKEYDTRANEYAQMLDLRAERIKKLEAQLKDIAYGTKQYKIDPEQLHELEAANDDAEIDATYELERGQNIIEIHIGKVLITKEGLVTFGNAEPITFVTFEFFEFEMQATPVVKGQRPSFGFTSQYIVNIDDFILHYIQRETLSVDFHQAVGTEYKTLATGRLRMNGLLEKGNGRIYGTLKLLGIEKNEEFAVLEYWLRLRVPMEQALRLYKERSKALGYMTSNALSSVNEEKPESLESGINELKITIHRCRKLKSTTKERQPSSYAVYRFFDFADHDTEIINHSSSPEFNDVQVFPVPMSEDLDSYLKTSPLEIYVFDDNETETGSYFGLATVPLVTLAQDKPIKGTFQLLEPNGKSRGTIDVSLQWSSSYLPATSKLRAYPKLSTSQGSISTKPPFAPLAGSFRPLRTDSIPEMPPDHLKQSISVSRAEPEEPEVMIGPVEAEEIKDIDDPVKAEEPSDIEGSVKPGLDFQVSLDNHPKTVSFKEDNLVFSGEASVASIAQEKEEVKERPVDEDLRNNDMIRKEEEKDDVVEDYGNNDETDEDLLEKEMRRTMEASDIDMPGSPVNNKEIGDDTIFEEPISDDVSADEDVVFIPDTSMSFDQNEGNALGSTFEKKDINSAETSDSEGVVVSSGSALASFKLTEKKLVVAIEIACLTFFETATLYNHENQIQLYVAYRFLDVDPATLETPDSLPLPQPNKPIHFNFKKVFHVDKETNNEQNQLLMSMLMPDHPSEGKLYFSIVSEPVDGDVCEDVGVACVDFVKMLEVGHDLVDEDIEILDFQGELIGCLTVTVEALDALRSFYD